MVHPPLAGGPRHHGRRGRHPQGPLRAAADPADVVPRQVAVRPVALAGDERPEHHPPVPVVRAAVPAAQRHSDHRGDGHPAGDVLAARRRRGGVDPADHRDGAALPAPVHQAVPRRAGPVRQRRNPRRGAGARPAGGQGVRPRAVRLRAVRRARHRPVRHRGAQGRGVGEVLDAARGHPERQPDHRARPRRLRGGQRSGDHGHAGRVHHDDAVAGVAHRLAGLPAVDDAGVHDGGQPRRRDLRRAARDHRRPAARRPAWRSAAARRRRVPVPRAATRVGAAARRTSRSNPARRSPWSGRPVRASRCWCRCCRGCTTSPRARSSSTGATSASCRCPRCGRRWPPRSRTRRCSRCRWPRTSGWAGPTRQRRAAGAGRRGRRRRLRLRPAVRPRHPDRRAGHEPVRRSAPTAFAGPGAARGAVDPGARRHAVGARRAHRGRGHRGAAPGAGLGDRRGRRQPGLDGAARRPGGAARGRHHHPRRHARRTARRCTASTATCWPPTTISTTESERSCDWEQDEDRKQARPPVPGARGGRRSVRRRRRRTRLRRVRAERRR